MGHWFGLGCGGCTAQDWQNPLHPMQQMGCELYAYVLIRKEKYILAMDCWCIYTYLDIIAECQFQLNHCAGSHPVRKT